MLYLIFISKIKLNSASLRSQAKRVRDNSKEFKILPPETASAYRLTAWFQCPCPSVWVRG